MSATRDLVPLTVADISTFCKSLRAQLVAADVVPLPSHLALLNMIAKAAGHRNYQALRAAPVAHPLVTAPIAAEPTALTLPRDPTLASTVKRAVTHFDTAGRMILKKAVAAHSAPPTPSKAWVDLASAT